LVDETGYSVYVGTRSVLGFVEAGLSELFSEFVVWVGDCGEI
jgi:hypothetical protein